MATDISTGIAKNIASGSDGSYLIPNLLAGTYDLSVTAAGFQKAIYSDGSEDRRVHPRRPGHHAAARLGRERFHPITATIRNGQPMF